VFMTLGISIGIDAYVLTCNGNDCFVLLGGPYS